MAHVIRLRNEHAEASPEVAVMPSMERASAAPARARATDDLQATARRGWIVLLVYFGILGGFAAMAPLGGAVVANGYFRSEGNRRVVQHLDGGIVTFLGVREGDHIQAGSVVLKLDETETVAELAVLERHHLALRMTEARVTAELTGAATLVFPPVLEREAAEPEVGALWRAQVSQFETQARRLDGRRHMIRDRIAQIEAGMRGTERQLASRRTQLVSMTRERDGLLPLVAQGIVTRPRITALERAIAEFEGEMAELAAGLEKARESIAEQRQSAEQVGHDHAAELARELRETQAQLVEILPRLGQARARAARTTVRAPATGRVVGLAVFAAGAVVGKGEKILEIVPDEDALVVAARIPVEQSADVRIGMAAEVRLTGLHLGAPPAVSGQVVHISADRLSDARDGHPHFEIVVRVDDPRVGPASALAVHAGMPATIVVPTVERTVLTYILDPLARAWSGALRER